ncbi:MAG: hypothetical protein U5N58_06030 [Actinomycetota bacterium]|nr:hypothetical protein [Actinomycetota bacterium]
MSLGWSREFLEATEKGYQFSIEKPAAAADILLNDNSELDRDIVTASQQSLSQTLYQPLMEGWGYMEEIWRYGFSGWKCLNRILLSKSP